jgi:hypothetical protein
MVAYPLSSAATEVLVDSSTERLRRLYLISTPKDDTSATTSVVLKMSEYIGNTFIEIYVVLRKHGS